MPETPKKLTIAVIAANGRSGRLFVDLALRHGHSVRAGVHNGGGLEAAEHLEIIQADATKPDEVSRLLEGCDAVVSMLGHVKGSPARVQTEAMRFITTAMGQTNCKRLISLTGTGVRFPGDRPSLLDRLLNIGIKLIDPQRIQDGIEHTKVLQASDTDWTLIRVLKLMNTKPGEFSLTPHGPAKLFTSREEVAEAALACLEQNSYVKQAPVISRLAAE
jgi:hypothetical protein